MKVKKKVLSFNVNINKVQYTNKTEMMKSRDMEYTYRRELLVSLGTTQ